VTTYEGGPRVILNKSDCRLVAIERGNVDMVWYMSKLNPGYTNDPEHGPSFFSKKGWEEFKNRLEEKSAEK